MVAAVINVSRLRWLVTQTNNKRGWHLLLTNICIIIYALSMLFFSATGTYWILSGQHTYCAAEQIRKEHMSDKKEVPEWTRLFRCRIMREDTDIRVRRLMAGKEQARALSGKSWSFGESMRYFMKMVQVKPCLCL